MEELLQYVWKHKIFPLQPLATTEGLPVEVIDPGLQNKDAGPDFFNAKVKIGGTLWVGNVEMHVRASDWLRHGHQCDKAYDNVVLHVVEEADCQVTRTDGEPIRQLVLDCPQDIRDRYEELRNADLYPPCYSVLPGLPRLVVHSWLSALLVERFQEKTDRIGRLLRRTQNDWETAFFVTLSRNFGFGLNGDAFESLALRLPFSAMAHHRDDILQVEAFFFGQAGLLDEEGGDDYYNRLRTEYKYLDKKFSLPAALDPKVWYFLRTRPNNFPHVRIAQLACLYHSKKALFSQVMEAETMDEVKKILRGATSDYWKTHYTFKNVSDYETEKTLGDGALNLILINTVAPSLYAYGMARMQDDLCRRATDFLEELPAEKNRYTKKWAGVGLTAQNAADSQAIIQLQKRYCERHDCLRCRIGFEYLRHKQW